MFRLKIQLKQSEKELETLNKKPDVIQDIEEQLTIFGAGKKKKVNRTENRRAELKTLITRLNKQITDGSNYSRLESVVNLASQLTSWNPYDQNDSSPFFDPEWMFGLTKQDNGYFDIVIGNPPYGVSIKGDYRKKVELFLGKVPDYEIYYYFMEISFNLLKVNGFKSLIIPNTFLFNVFAAKYREKLLEIWQIICLIDCSAFKIFEGATVFNAITLFRKVIGINQNLIGYKPTKNAIDFNTLSNRTTEYLSKDGLLKNNQNWALAFRLDKDILQILIKIRAISTPLSDLFPEISQGLIAYDKYQGQDEYTIKNRVYHYNEESKPGLKKWLWGEDVTKHSINWNQKEWVDYCSGIANPRHPKFFIGKRLLVREITNPSIFCAITDEELYHDPAIIVILDSPNNLNNLCIILNSNLGSFYHFNSSPKATKGAFPKILVEDIKNFPIRLANNQSLMNMLINDIANEKESEGYDNIQNKINNIVYRLYDLTYSEIRVIDPFIEIKISEVDYNAISID